VKNNKITCNTAMKTPGQQNSKTFGMWRNGMMNENVGIGNFDLATGRITID